MPKPAVTLTIAVSARQAKTLQQDADAMGTSVEASLAEAIKLFIDCIVPSRTYYSHGRRLRFLTDAEWKTARPEEWAAAKVADTEREARDAENQAEYQAAMAAWKAGKAERGVAHA